MSKRIVGAVGFVGLFYITLLWGPVFNVLLALFLFFGLYELKNIYLKSEAKMQTILYSIAFILFIISLWYISTKNVPLVIYITALLMLNDTLAFAVGKSFGKHQLSKISPNKTIEGSIGGLLLSPFATIGIMLLLTIIFAGYTAHIIPFDFTTIGDYNPFTTITPLIFVSFILSALGQIGDLTESWFKRSADIKDSGTIVYGHGGILDRIDSWIFPITLMAVIMLII